MKNIQGLLEKFIDSAKKVAEISDYFKIYKKIGLKENI